MLIHIQVAHMLLVLGKVDPLRKKLTQMETQTSVLVQ